MDNRPPATLHAGWRHSSVLWCKEGARETQVVQCVAVADVKPIADILAIDFAKEAESPRSGQAEGGAGGPGVFQPLEKCFQSLENPHFGGELADWPNAWGIMAVVLGANGWGALFFSLLFISPFAGGLGKWTGFSI